MTKRILTTIGLAALTVGMMTTAAGAQSPTTYSAQIDSLNDSGSSAEATIQVDEATNEATVTIDGSGFPAAPHAQHVHGFDEGSTCPTGDELDEDGDGFTSTPEAQPAYGPIEVSLTTEGDTSPDSALAVERFPTYEASYERTFELPEEVADNLGNYHIVIHGNDVNGNGEYDMDGAGASPLDESLPFEATMPAACGTLAATASGGVDTGAGGTADAGSDAPLGSLPSVRWPSEVSSTAFVAGSPRADELRHAPDTTRVVRRIPRMHPGRLPIAAVALAGALLLPTCAAGSSPDDVEVAQENGFEPNSSPTSRSPAPSTNLSDESPDITSQAHPKHDSGWEDVPASLGLDPARIQIPSIGVDAEVVDLGLNPDGTLEVPDSFANTGWFSKGPQPGQYGASVIAGHIDSTDGPAVFFRLDELVAGDRVIVEAPDDDTVTFQVETVEQFDKDAFPTERVYSFTRQPTLRLVTCGGPFDDTVGHYEDNVIAFARRVPPEQSPDEPNDG